MNLKRFELNGHPTFYCISTLYCELSFHDGIEVLLGCWMNKLIDKRVNIPRSPVDIDRRLDKKRLILVMIKKKTSLFLRVYVTRRLKNFLLSNYWTIYAVLCELSLKCHFRLRVDRIIDVVVGRNSTVSAVMSSQCRGDVQARHYIGRELDSIHADKRIDVEVDADSISSR